MESNNKVKPVKVTAKDWERMRGVLLKSNSSASKTIKDMDKAVTRFAVGCVLCAVHKITEYNQCAYYPFKYERDSVLDNINGLGIYSKYKFDDYVVPFGKTAMELGATIEQINATIDTIWPTFRKEFDMAVDLYNKQKAAEAEAARLAKEEAERKEAERMEKVRNCKTEAEFISLTKYDLSKEEALIWVEKFGKKFKKNQSNYRYTNTWKTWQGRIGCTHAELQKWSNAKQEWKKTESRPDWRPLAVCHGYTSGVPSYMGGDFSYTTVVQDWRDLNNARSDYDNETFTIYKHPHQY